MSGLRSGFGSGLGSGLGRAWRWLERSGALRDAADAADVVSRAVAVPVVGRPGHRQAAPSLLSPGRSSASWRSSRETGSSRSRVFCLGRWPGLGDVPGDAGPRGPCGRGGTAVPAAVGAPCGGSQRLRGCFCAPVAGVCTRGRWLCAPAGRELCTRRGGLHPGRWPWGRSGRFRPHFGCKPPNRVQPCPAYRTFRPRGGCKPPNRVQPSPARHARRHAPAPSADAPCRSRPRPPRSRTRRKPGTRAESIRPARAIRRTGKPTTLPIRDESRTRGQGALVRMPERTSGSSVGRPVRQRCSVSRRASRGRRAGVSAICRAMAARRRSSGAAGRA